MKDVQTFINVTLGSVSSVSGKLNKKTNIITLKYKNY